MCVWVITTRCVAQHSRDLFINKPLAGCATASTTAKTAEATVQTTGRYLLEIDRSNDQSSDRGQILLSIVFIIPHSVRRSLE